MKIWTTFAYGTIHLFNNERDFELLMTSYYNRLWEENLTTPPPATWQEMKTALLHENLPNDNFIIVHTQDLQVPPDSEEAFGCLYNYIDIEGALDGYDPALHREALEDWVRFERSSIEEAMSDTVWSNLIDIETLMDPGAYWRWDNATDEYEIWADEQRA